MNEIDSILAKLTETEALISSLGRQQREAISRMVQLIDRLVAEVRKEADLPAQRTSEGGVTFQ